MLFSSVISLDFVLLTEYAPTLLFIFDVNETELFVENV